MYRDFNALTNKSSADPLKLFIADVRLPKTSWKAEQQRLGPVYRQPWNISPQSCCRSAWRRKSLNRQNAADDDLLPTTADSRRPGKPEWIYTDRKTRQDGRTNINRLDMLDHISWAEKQ